MCWPSQAQSSPSSSRMQVAVRSSASVAAGGVLDLGRQRRAEQAVAEGDGRGVSSSQRVSASVALAVESAHCVA